jgi:N-acetyl-beta-hexosaminidase
MKNLDYPDYLLTAWLTFEHQHGSLVNLERTISTVKVARKILDHRRRKAARQMAAAQVVEVPLTTEVTSTEASTSAFISSAVEGSTTNKRAREEEVVQAAVVAKKVKVDAASDEPKRYRLFTSLQLYVPQNNHLCAREGL